MCIRCVPLPRLNPRLCDTEALVNDHNPVSRQQTQLPMVHSPAWFQLTDNATWCLAQPGSTTQPPEVKPTEVIHLIVMKLTDISKTYIPHTVQHSSPH